MSAGRDSITGMGMTEQQERIAQEREEIAARVATFKATQEKFEREREEFFVATLENARHSFGRPAWSWRQTKSPEAVLMRFSSLPWVQGTGAPPVGSCGKSQAFRNEKSDTEFTSQVQQPRKG
jgi:hypothetical protein